MKAEALEALREDYGAGLLTTVLPLSDARVEMGN